MARFPHDQNTKVYYVPSLANKAAPTVAELNAGTDISEFLPKDGLTVPATQNNVPDDSLASRFDAELPGTWGGQVVMILKRDNTADTAWDLFTYGLAGFIVVRRGEAFDNAWAAADQVEVYPGSSHQKVMAQTGANVQARFTVMWPCSEEPDMEAVVAA